MNGDLRVAAFGSAVDLAHNFWACWTHEGSEAEVNEFARQLRDELMRLLAAARAPEEAGQ